MNILSVVENPFLNPDWFLETISNSFDKKVSSTDPGLFKLTDISYRLRFSFALFACIIRSFFVFHSFAFRSCNWFVRFVYRSFRSSI